MRTIAQGVGKPAGAKLIRVDASIVDGVVETIVIRGDFFAVPEDAFERVELRLEGTALADVAARFDALLTEEGVQPYGISGAAVAEVLAAAVAAAEASKGTPR